MTNGTLGFWIGRDGTGHSQTAFRAGAYTPRVSIELLPFPSPLGMTVIADGKPWSVTESHDYRQVQDLTTGALTTEWKAPDGSTVKSTLDLARPDQSIQFHLVVTPAKDTRIQIQPDDLGSGPEHPFDTVRTPECVNGSWDFDAKAGNQIALDIRVSPHSVKPLGRQLSIEELPQVPCTITLDGPVDDQQAISSMCLNLRLGVDPDGPTSPFGVSNTRYSGRVFWDSDIWMFPALALLDPERANSIPNFRLQTADAAKVAYSEWIHATKSRTAKDVGYSFPWEAGPEGQEEGIGDEVGQDHVTGSVAFGLGTAAALGIIEPESAQRVIDGAAAFYLERSTPNSSGIREILQSMSPDEYAKLVDNDLYTNSIAQWCVDHSTSRNKATKFKLGRDETTFMTYDTDNFLGYKQAAALLAVWPLQNPACEKEAAKMLDRFAGKTTPNGPAMSTCVEALIRARFGDADQAYSDWRKSWMDHSKRPMLMFSETPNGKRAYFLTGAGGCLDAFLFGFVGLRIDDHDPGSKPWKTLLKNGYWLSCEPHLPQAWKSVTLDNLRLLGTNYTLVATAEHVKVTLRRPPPRSH